MKIVIQCAATKNPTPFGAGFRTADNRLVKFVANPKLAPNSEKYAYVNPDDLSDGQQTWRERLLSYNQDTASNSLRLSPAYKLYTNSAYQDLVKKFGLGQVFILSAGWGMISANFLTPDYDITFSKAKNVETYCRRNKSDKYADICQLPDDGELIVFLGGKDYQPLFRQLTKDLKGVKKVFFNALDKPNPEYGFCFERYVTQQKTNWHYACAQDIILGKTSI